MEFLFAFLGGFVGVLLGELYLKRKQLLGPHRANSDTLKEPVIVDPAEDKLEDREIKQILGIE